MESSQQPKQPLPPEKITLQNPASLSNTTHDPGKTLGIIGFIFAFVGLQIVGLILSIIGFNRSRHAGFNNSLALVGIILNAIFMILGIIAIGLFIVTMISYNGISQRANDSASKASASTVMKWSELYDADNGSYPTSFHDLNTYTDTTNIQENSGPILSAPSNPSTIEFYTCGSDGNKIGYWSYTLSEVLYVYSGSAASSSDCIQNVS